MRWRLFPSHSDSHPVYHSTDWFFEQISGQPNSSVCNRQSIIRFSLGRHQYQYKDSRSINSQILHEHQLHSKQFLDKLSI